MLQDVYTTDQSGIFDLIGEGFETVSAVPGQIIEFGQDLNERIIAFSRRLQGSAGQAEENLRRTQTQTEAARIGSRIVENQGFIIGALVIAVLFFLFRT